MTRHLFLLLEDLLRPISGSLGKKLRRLYYSRRFAKCGQDLDIAAGVRIVNPHMIEIGDSVAIDFNCILLAGKISKLQHVNYLSGFQEDGLEGKICIGSYSHIGINNIIQGHGGVSIGEYFTSSANCTMYSLSNDPGQCRKGTLEVIGHETDARYVSGNIHIGRNVWIGLGVNLLSCRLDDDVFVKAGTTVTGHFEKNSVVGGSPSSPLGSRFK